VQTFELADELPPVGGDVLLAAGDASNEVDEDDQVDWEEIQSDDAESSQGEHEVPPQGNPRADSSSRAVAGDIIHLEMGDGDDDDDDDDDDEDPIAFRLPRRAPTRQVTKPPSGAPVPMVPLHRALAVQSRLNLVGLKRGASGEKMPELSTPLAPAAQAVKKM
jgi:hypothetical protein